MNHWVIIWITVYLFLITFIAIRHLSAIDIQAYIINKRNTGLLLLVTTTVATFVGGGVSVGLIAMGYESGFAAIAIGIAYVIGFMLCGFCAPSIHRVGNEMQLISLPEYITKSYSSNSSPLFNLSFQFLVSSVNIAVLFFLLSAQFVGMAAILKYSLGLDYIFAAVISCVITIAYTSIAGFAGVIITDAFQFILIIIVLLFIFIPGAIADTKNFTGLTELPCDFLNGTHYGIVFLIALPLFLAPSVLSRMDIWQRILAANSPKTAKQMCVISGFMMLPFYVIFPLVGMAVRITSSETVSPKDAVNLFMTKHCNSSFVLGFVVVCLISALMSSADSFLNLISLSITYDLLGRKKVSTSSSVDEGNKINIASKNDLRLSAIVVGIMALVVALLYPKLVDLMVVGTAVIVVFTPSVILALWKKQVVQYRYYAALSISIGFAVNMSFFVLGILKPNLFQSKASFIPAFICSSLIIAYGLLTKRRDSEC